MDDFPVEPNLDGGFVPESIGAADIQDSSQMICSMFIQCRGTAGLWVSTLQALRGKVRSWHEQPFFDQATHDCRPASALKCYDPKRFFKIRHVLFAFRVALLVWRLHTNPKKKTGPTRVAVSFFFVFVTFFFATELLTWGRPWTRRTFWLSFLASK